MGVMMEYSPLRSGAVDRASSSLSRASKRDKIAPLRAKSVTDSGR
jgi:hypothetical protein